MTTRFTEIEGDFFNRMISTEPDALVCTINTVCKTDGKLVMGAGIAQFFRDHFHGIDEHWGKRTKEMGPMPDKTYPFVEPMIKETGHGSRIEYLVGIHTKYDWRQNSPLDLIDRSVKQLYIISRSLGWKKILMTRPGCGHGGRSWEHEVRPIMRSILDERFEVIHNG